MEYQPVELPEGADPLLTAKQFALLLGCSTDHLWRQVHRRTLPEPIHIGGLRRWPLSEVTALIEQRKEAAR